MRKSTILILTIIFSVSLQAQTVEDAYRYSQDDLNGTARFSAMGGAFGALGGDLGAIFINPASSSVYLSSSASGTLNWNRLNSDYQLNNSPFRNQRSQFDISNLGGVFVFNNNSGSDWRKIAVSAAFTTKATYDESFRVNGTSANSISDYFLSFTEPDLSLDLLQTQEGESVSDLYQFLGNNYGFGLQQALLGFQGYVLDYDPDATGNPYVSLISPGTFDQRYIYNSTGINGKFTFNASTQYRDFLNIGVSVNAHFLNYENATEYQEFNSNPNSETTEVYFGNSLYTNGEGFSLQVGGIAKLTEEIRVGASYESPTWLNVREETTQYIETNSPQDEFVSVYPDVINVYPEYQLRTPGNLTASFAYVFGKSGLISFDYSYKDYRNMHFKSRESVNFDDLNRNIENVYTNSSSYRVGTEYRFNKLSLRLGYRMEGSPFADAYDRIGDRNVYSGGLGYSFGSVNLDLAYTRSDFNENVPMLNTGFGNQIRTDRSANNVFLTLSFGL